MDIKKLSGKILALSDKYKYALLVLLVGLILLLIPSNQSKPKKAEPILSATVNEEVLTQEALAQILQTVEGAGKVKVLLSMGAGEQTIYQTDTDNNSSANNTVIVTDSERNESGLIQQINPAAYKGAVIVCQGADSPAVRLSITQAVSKITGLGTDAICVLKMQ